MWAVKYFQLVENIGKMRLNWRVLGMLNRKYGSGKGATLCTRSCWTVHRNNTVIQWEK